MMFTERLVPSPDLCVHQIFLYRLPQKHLLSQGNISGGFLRFKIVIFNSFKINKNMAKKNMNKMLANNLHKESLRYPSWCERFRSELDSDFGAEAATFSNCGLGRFCCPRPELVKPWQSLRARKNANVNQARLHSGLTFLMCWIYHPGPALIKVCIRKSKYQLLS